MSLFLGLRINHFLGDSAVGCLLFPGNLLFSLQWEKPQRVDGLFGHTPPPPNTHTHACTERGNDFYSVVNGRTQVS